MIINDKEFLFEIEGQTFHCALDITMAFVGGKWKSVVLWYLRKESLRFSEIRKRIPQLTESLLTHQLRELEESGLVCREVEVEKPPRVVRYSLTDFGKTVLPMLESMAEWGRNLAAERGRLVPVGKKSGSRLNRIKPVPG